MLSLVETGHWLFLGTIDFCSEAAFALFENIFRTFYEPLKTFLERFPKNQESETHKQHAKIDFWNKKIK